MGGRKQESVVSILEIVKGAAKGVEVGPHVSLEEFKINIAKRQWRTITNRKGERGQSSQMQELAFILDEFLGPSMRVIKAEESVDGHDDPN